MHKNRRRDSERISIAELRRRFEYDKENGGLYRTGTGRGEVRKCGSVKTTGYVFVKITHDGKTNDYSMHSLVWAWHHGYWAKELNHSPDADKENNRIENLKECSHHENMIEALAKPVRSSDGKTYISITEAAKFHNTSVTCLSKVLNGKTKTSYKTKLQWSYI